MKDRRKREVVTWSRFFWCTVFVVLSCVIFTGFTTFRLFEESFHPVLLSSWRNPALEALSDEYPSSPPIEIRETVIFPDQVLIFLKYPPSVPLFTKELLDCAYFPANSTHPLLKLPPAWVDGEDPNSQIVRCPLPNQRIGSTVTASLSWKSNGHLSPGPTHRWDSLVYEAIVDRDNTTLVFVKGLNLRPERLSDPSRFECVYGWDFKSPRFVLNSEVLSAAQEIVRCRTPLSVLSSIPHQKNLDRSYDSIKVSVRVKAWRRSMSILHSVAQPQPLPESDTHAGKKHGMCVCTMLRNQARFLKEWVMYHARIGVNRWFIYDNNSEDDIEPVVDSLDGSGFNITRHIWPWIKTQESGFAHCALRARDSCEWVGFIDVDEFLHLPLQADPNTNQTVSSLHDLLAKQPDQVAELRSWCYNFGPSGLTKVPEGGVTVGYTCRMGLPERHKSIVRPEALDPSLMNVVHHFHLRDGFESVNVERGVLVINHYKYQVWEVFKEKFYRRVATYVADWQVEENVGSKDRAPGLGTRAVEPDDWSNRFCEVNDTGLKDWVMQVLAHPRTLQLPWQQQLEEREDRLLLIEEDKRKNKRRRKRGRVRDVH